MEKIIDLEDVLQKIKDTQGFCNDILHWEPHLRYLVGQRVTKEVSINQLTFRSDNKPSICIVDAALDLTLVGNIHEFQKLACQILAKYPLTQKE